MSSPSIVFNGRFLQQPVTGVQRFAVEILQALDALIENQEIKIPPPLIAVPKKTTSRVSFKNINIVEVGNLQGYPWEQFELPKFAGDRLLVGLCNTGPILKKNQAIVIHDAAVFSVPEAYDRIFRTVYKFMHRSLARRGAKILTVSEFSKQELAKHLKLQSQRITVLPEGCEHVLRVHPDESILDRADLRKRPFAFAVSSMQANKNFSFVANALSEIGDPGFDVVVAGGTNPAVFRDAGLALPPFIKHVGYVSDEELVCLYQQAACFIFPSIYEGFGIPPLEAMAHGCPVLASNAASIPEVCGNAAIYFDPKDKTSFLTALDQMMSNQKMRAQLKELSHQQSQKWTWSTAAHSLLCALRDR